MMNRTGEQGDAVPTHLITKVLAGHADLGGSGGNQDNDIQLVIVLGSVGELQVAVT